MKQRVGSSEGRWLHHVNRLSVEMYTLANRSFFSYLSMLDQHGIDYTETWALETDSAPHNPSPPFAVFCKSSIVVLKKILKDARIWAKNPPRV